MSAQVSIPDRVYFRIGDVSEIAGIKPHVLRYWESEFSEIAPEKTASGQRVYRRRTVETVLLIKKLLYQDRYSIDGARRRLRELRRDGALASECREAADPLPAAERDARAQALTGVRRLLADVESLNQRPIRDSHRY